MTYAQVAVDGLLTFTVTGRLMALQVSDVVEIFRPPVVTPIPHGPSSLMGVANIRGAVVPVLSVADMLGQVQSPMSAMTRVIIVDKQIPIGLTIDEVHSLAPTSDAEIIDLDALLARDFATLSLQRNSRTIDRAARAAPGAMSKVTDDTVALMGFMLGGQEYALPLEKVAEVVKLPETSAEIPLTDHAMIGVMALRDRLLPLVSARVLLGLARDDSGSRAARVVVIRLGHVLVGLVVDAMSAILRPSAQMIDAVPPVLLRGDRETQIDAICRLDGGRRLISILSPTRIFDDETTAHILAQTGDAAAGITDADTQDDVTEQFVLFTLAGERFGLPIAAVQEIIHQSATIVPLPRAPEFIVGMMNLRGKAIPVIDQRLRFAVEGARDRSGRVIILNIAGLQAGLLVDGASEILTVSRNSLSPAPKLPSVSTGVFDLIAMAGEGGKMILLIDAAMLLDQAQRDILQTVIERDITAIST